MRPWNNRAWVLLVPAMALLAVVGALPLLAVINYGFHDIFTLADVHWVGLEWFGDILGSDRFVASLGRSLLFSSLALAVQVPLGIAVALLLLSFGRRAIWGLMLCALPLVVPWNMIPMLWLGLIDAKTGMLGPGLAAVGFDYKFTALHTWLLILTVDTWHWLGLVVVLAYAGLSAIPTAYRQAAAIDGATRWAVFRHVELPRIAGALAIVLLLRFVDSFMIYTEAFAINAGGPNDATRFLSIELGEEIKGFSYGQAAARATLYFLFVLAVVWSFVLATRARGGRRMMRVLALVGLVAFILLPLLQAVLLSFTLTLPRDGIVEGAVGLMNYAAVLAAPELRAAMVNSAVYVVLNVGLCLALGLPAAYALARYRFLGDRHVLLAMLVFRVTPPVVLSLPIFILFSRLGLVNSPLGIALVHCLFNLPVAIWILESFIRTVPRALDETAFLDGHSGLSFFFRHLIPAIAPGIGVAAFFCFIFSWVEVVFARILTVTAGKPITMAIGAMFGFQTDIGMVMAMTCLSLLPGVAMIWLVRNHLARGFMLRA